MKAHLLYKALIDHYYDQALQAKQAHQPVGWATSSFPCELPEALGLPVLYPENHAALLSAQKEAPRFLLAAEQQGYSNDLCSYARINLGYCLSFDAKSRNLVRPDFLLCATNTCHQLLKWFSLLSDFFHVPLFVLDVPYQITGSNTPDKTTYLEAQAEAILDRLSALAGKPRDPKRLKDVMDIARTNGKLWQNILAQEKAVPAPVNGFDLFVYMSAIVTMRPKKETTFFLAALLREMKEASLLKHSAFPGKEEHRLQFEGVCCWPCLYEMQVPLIRHHLNVVSASYLSLFGLVYTDFRDMPRAYSMIPNSQGITVSLEAKTETVRTYRTDGILFNLTRSCRIWCGYDFALERNLRETTLTKTLIVDSDQADSRNFSFAPYETRVEAFSEMLAAKEK